MGCKLRLFIYFGYMSHGSFDLCPPKPDPNFGFSVEINTFQKCISNGNDVIVKISLFTWSWLDQIILICMTPLLALGMRWSIKVFCISNGLIFTSFNIYWSGLKFWLRVVFSVLPFAVTFAPSDQQFLSYTANNSRELILWPWFCCPGNHWCFFLSKSESADFIGTESRDHNHFASHYILTIGRKIICKLIFIKKENQIHEFHDFLLLSEKQSNRQSDVGQIIKKKRIKNIVYLFSAEITLGRLNLAGL